VRAIQFANHVIIGEQHTEIGMQQVQLSEHSVTDATYTARVEGRRARSTTEYLGGHGESGWGEAFLLPRNRCLYQASLRDKPAHFAFVETALAERRSASTHASQWRQRPLWTGVVQLA
jgi:hypothetical protein